MYKLVDTVVEIMGKEYPYLKEKAPVVKEQIQLEEARFFKTIESGITLFDEEMKNTKDIFSGEVAFKLYDTFGFPLDLTQDMLKSHNIGLDSKKFKELMLEQRTRAKASWKGSGDIHNHGDFKELLQQFGENEFVGYETTSSTAKVLALLNSEFKCVNSLDINEDGWVMLDKTPFYAQSGGQVGDTGKLECRADVKETRDFFGLNLSSIKVTSSIKVGISVDANVSGLREQIVKHHSATHLLHAVLYDVLGDHISQAGSLNDEKKLRFDFSHPKALEHSQLVEIEQRVNALISQGIKQETKVMSIEDAKKSSAKAQFGEKYGDDVRVVSFDDKSVEFCGGCHVKNTAKIGSFIITKESGVSAGVRRIEAVTGHAAYEHFTQQRILLKRVEHEVKNLDVIAGITRLKLTNSDLKTELRELKNSVKIEIDTQEINGVTVVVDELTSGDIKEKIDELKNKNAKLCAMLFQVKGDKVLIAAGVKDSDAKAGEWIKKIAPILGGGGGGRPDFAQAGGKDKTKLPQAKEEALKFIMQALS
jgi:alanyl-tRNA synthetase